MKQDLINIIKFLIVMICITYIISEIGSCAKDDVHQNRLFEQQLLDKGLRRNWLSNEPEPIK